MNVHQMTRDLVRRLRRAGVVRVDLETSVQGSGTQGMRPATAAGTGRPSDRQGAGRHELRSVVEMVPGCPRVVWQADLPWGAPGEGRVDALVPDWRLVLEADGRRWHARVRDFDADRWRDNQAAALGLRVQRFTWTHVTQRRHEVIALIAAAGAATTVAA